MSDKQSMWMDAVDRATWAKRDYMSLNCFSDDIKDSILWFVNQWFRSEGLETVVNRKWKMDWLSDPRTQQQVTEALKAHGMAGILTDEWRAFFVNEFLTKATAAAWDHAYSENEWFDRSVAEKARIAEYHAERKAAEIARARKILEQAGE